MQPPQCDSREEDSSHGKMMPEKIIVTFSFQFSLRNFLRKYHCKNEKIQGVGLILYPKKIIPSGFA
jgi:hypothetical protein